MQTPFQNPIEEYIFLKNCYLKVSFVLMFENTEFLLFFLNCCTNRWCFKKGFLLCVFFGALMFQHHALQLPNLTRMHNRYLQNLKDIFSTSHLKFFWKIKGFLFFIYIYFIFFFFLSFSFFLKNYSFGWTNFCFFMLHKNFNFTWMKQQYFLNTFFSDA